ncbi:MAG: DUF2914 domain-containing protein [Patescibacteria group bacterium]
MSLLEPFRKIYGRFERPISSLSLIAGFLFDALTLKRVDTLWENSWVLAHIVIVGVFIILIHAHEGKAGDEQNPDTRHFWYVNILQFFFGGILSTYIVFYFRSADLFVTWPFILLLAIAFIANESLKRHYVRMSFQISLFFLSIYSFAIFLVPVLFHRIGVWMFILSGIISLITILLFLLILYRVTKQKYLKSRKVVALTILSICVVINILYFTNLIPPIPLSLKDGGMYHVIIKNPDGDYSVYNEDLGWRKYFQLFPRYTEVIGEPVYAYTAIFSPSRLNLTIVHKWQKFDEVSRRWATESSVELPVIGGRDGGFRTYSVQYDLPPGTWRVNVETEQGQLIGRIRFTIVQGDTKPELIAEIK